MPESTWDTSGFNMDPLGAEFVLRMTDADRARRNDEARVRRAKRALSAAEAVVEGQLTLPGTDGPITDKAGNKITLGRNHSLDELRAAHEVIASQKEDIKQLQEVVKSYQEHVVLVDAQRDATKTVNKEHKTRIATARLFLIEMEDLLSNEYEIEPGSAEERWLLQVRTWLHRLDEEMGVPDE